MSDDEIILILEKRFIQNKNMHKDIKWDDVKKRIKNEEEVLEKELNGYKEYKTKVKYKVIPFIW